MNRIPVKPKIYHITHVDNLTKIVAADGLWSDQKRIDLGLDTNLVGMSSIKRRRLESIQVTCWSGSMVGQYVPFYYCPRSVMLYILHRGNHIDLDYRGGQNPIVHLRIDLLSCMDWADENAVPWAICSGNAGAFYADFYGTRKDLARLDWTAIGSPDFRDSMVKERKQAEFLVRDAVPWSLVEHVGVFDKTRSMQAVAAIANCSHRPSVGIENDWYY